jgi:CRP/FNR family cyclic AMP-dependent transcriptional regulator
MTPVAAVQKRRKFNLKAFLSTIDGGRTIATFTKKQRVFDQGDLGDAVFYIQRGKARLSVVSKKGKEATIGVLNEGDFFGEGCLVGQPLRMCTATAMTDCKLMRIDKKSMMAVIHREHAFSDMFVAYLLTRNIRYEEDLVDQLFNSSEKRLASILLLLAHFGKDGKPEVAIPKISQETLAEMVGTTRGRVSFFMNRFRKLGFVRYNGELEVHNYCSALCSTTSRLLPIIERSHTIAPRSTGRLQRREAAAQELVTASLSLQSVLCRSVVGRKRAFTWRLSQGFAPLCVKG